MTHFNILQVFALCQKQTWVDHHWNNLKGENYSPWTSIVSSWICYDHALVSMLNYFFSHHLIPASQRTLFLNYKVFEASQGLPNSEQTFWFTYVSYGGKGYGDWGTALQTERSRFRFPMLSMEIIFFHWHNPSGRSIALGSTQPLKEMSIFPGV